MQTVYDLLGQSVLRLDLPSPETLLFGSVPWGDAGGLFTPAFWKARLWYARNRRDDAYLDYGSGKSLSDEVVACLLGGHGIPSEMAQAAFLHLQSEGHLSGRRMATAAAIEQALKIPLKIEGRERPVRYRFPHVKAGFVAEAMRRLDIDPPEDDRAFRDWLMDFPGIGPKTASWITRNWRHSNAVAVIDIHVFRAGVVARIFSGAESTISSRYRNYEDAFLKFAAALDEEPRRLDVLIWRTMKDSAALGLRIFRAARSPLPQAA